MTIDHPEAVIVAFDSQALPLDFPGFPHRLALLPEGMAFADIPNNPSVIGIFLIEPGSVDEALSSRALPAYLDRRAPVLFHARRARDLRPVLRRRQSFADRGYSVGTLP